MNLSHLTKNIPIEIICPEELTDLRVRESEESFDFEDIKKYMSMREKLSIIMKIYE